MIVINVTALPQNGHFFILSTILNRPSSALLGLRHARILTDLMRKAADGVALVLAFGLDFAFPFLIAGAVCMTADFPLFASPAW